jgi:hypothetical protein
MNSRVGIAFVLGALATTGCAGTVRVKTAGMWWTPGGPPPAAAAAAAPAASGAAPAAAPAPAPAAGPGGTVYYVSNWEGQCGGVRKFVPYVANCNAGNGKVLRCNLGADNSVVCVEEAEANKVLATE